MLGIACRWILAPLVFGALVNKRELHGLLVAEGPHRRFQDEGFHDAVAEALNVLERYDPRRFGRVGRNLRAICNGPLASTALYQPVRGQRSEVRSQKAGIGKRETPLAGASG